MRESKTILDSEFYAVVEFWIPVHLYSVFQSPGFQITRAKFRGFQIHEQKFPRLWDPHSLTEGGKDVWFDCGVIWYQGVLLISSDWNDQMGAKIKTQKNPWDIQQNLKKSLDQHLTPNKSHAEFLSNKNFQKALDDTTWKIEILVLIPKKIPT